MAMKINDANNSCFFHRRAYHKIIPKYTPCVAIFTFWKKIFPWFSFTLCDCNLEVHYIFKSVFNTIVQNNFLFPLKILTRIYSFFKVTAYKTRLLFSNFTLICKWYNLMTVAKYNYTHYLNFNNMIILYKILSI